MRFEYFLHRNYNKGKLQGIPKKQSQLEQNRHTRVWKKIRWTIGFGNTKSVRNASWSKEEGKEIVNCDVASRFTRVMTGIDRLKRADK